MFEANFYVSIFKVGRSSKHLKGCIKLPLLKYNFYPIISLVHLTRNF